MVYNVALEKVDANMEEATVGAWLVAEGEVIEPGAKFVELVTDKVTFEYESPVGGTVRRLLATAGSLVPVGFVLAQIGAAEGELTDPTPDNERLLAEHRAKLEVTIDTGSASAAAAPSAGGRVRATPAARRLARELGIDLATVQPAEAGGIVSEDDVRRAAS